MLPGTQRHWALSLRQNSAHLSREIHASCRSPVCSGCFWPSLSLVGMLPNMGVSVQGERTAHRHVVLHRDLGKKGKLEKSKQASYDFNFFVFGSSITPTLFYSLLHLCFLIFFPQHLLWPRKLLKTSQIYPVKWGSQSPWIVGMKQVGAITNLFGTSNFPVDRWLTLFVCIQKAVMQGTAATL